MMNFILDNPFVLSIRYRATLKHVKIIFFAPVLNLKLAKLFVILQRVCSTFASFFCHGMFCFSFHDGRVMVNYPWDDRWIIFEEKARVELDPTLTLGKTLEMFTRKFKTQFSWKTSFSQSRRRRRSRYIILYHILYIISHITYHILYHIYFAVQLPRRVMQLCVQMMLFSGLLIYV